MVPYEGFLNRLKVFILSGADLNKNGMACVLLKNSNAIFGGLILPSSVRLF